MASNADKGAAEPVKHSSTASGSEFDLFLVYGLVVLYALCYQLQRPIEPFLVDKLVKNATGSEGSKASESYAMLQSFFSICQTVGSLVGGYILDRFGVRAGFMVNFLACAGSYALLANATSIEMLYLSKIPGIMQMGFLCAQTAVARLAPKGAKRVQAMGRLTMAYTVGATVGPAVGGWLGSSGNYYLGAKHAVGASLFACICVYLLPEHIDESVDVEDAAPSEGEAQTSEQESWPTRAVKVLSVVWMLLALKVGTSIANSMYGAALPIILKDHVGLDEQAMGFLMSGNSMAVAIFTGFLLGPITELHGNSLFKTVRSLLCGMFTLYVLQAVLYHPTVDIKSMLPLEPKWVAQAPLGLISLLLAVQQYSLGTSITSESTGRVPESAKGTLLGMEHSLFSLARVFGPATGIALLNNHGISALSGTCAGAFGLAAVLWVQFAGPQAAAKREKVA